MKKQRFHIRKKGNKWTGEPEAKGGGIVSTSKEEVLGNIKDKARFHRPSEVIVHKPQEGSEKETFDDKKEPNKPIDFITD